MEEDSATDDERDREDFEAALEKWRGAIDPEKVDPIREFLHARRGTQPHKRREPTGGDDAEQSDPADLAEMRGSIESDGHATEHLRADRDAERRARDGDTATQPREIRDSAGNWPGVAEAIRTRRAGLSQPRLAIATAPVEDTAGRVAPAGEVFELTAVGSAFLVTVGLQYGSAILYSRAQ